MSLSPKHRFASPRAIRRTTPDLNDLLETTELPESTDPATGPAAPAAGHGARRRPLAALRHPALYVAAAAAGALMVNVLTVGQPAAQADTQSVSIAEQLGVQSGSATVRPLEQLVADRSQRQAEQTAAARTQAAAQQAELQKKAAAAAAAKAAAAKGALLESRAKLAAARAAAARAALQASRAKLAAARAAAAAAAKAAAARAAAPAAAPAAAAAAPAAGGSFQGYALSKLGGSSSQMSCLQSLWGRESGWNPNAQNPGSTAYGIPQFLDSTWAGTGIAKTSNGYRQIDAGLIYLDQRYGSPCGGWAHSQSTGWY
jgi:hypothetical protein